jgi:predicted nucleotidyltransferase
MDGNARRATRPSRGLRLLGVPKGTLEDFCRPNHIRRLALFGSTLTGEATAESDIDLLVEFLPGHVPGFFRLIGMEDELSAILGRRVDLRTPEDLGRRFRDEVVASAEVLYAEV